MPLIILTGYPCSGLTYRARQLATLFEEIQSTSNKARYKIHIVGSHDESQPRTVYDTARSEKQARAVVYARVKRSLGRDSIVIVDGMNYIKGWRYQLWCESKEAKTTCCVVHVGTPIDQCVTNNEARLKRKREDEQSGRGTSPSADEPGSHHENKSGTTSDKGSDEEPYQPELLTNLIYRYEEPTTASRWDKPMFTVPWSDSTPPIEDIWFAITGQSVEKQNPPLPLQLDSTSTPAESKMNDAASLAPTTATSMLSKKPLSSRPKIVPHQATAKPPSTDPTALYALDKRTSEILSALREFSLKNRSSSSLSTQILTDPSLKGLTIPIPSTKTPIFIPSSTLATAATDDLAGAGGILALPRLQRLRRQWVGMNRTYAGHGHGLGQGTVNADEAGEAFVRFLNAEFEGVNDG